MTLTERIAEKLVERGLSQRLLARRAGIERSHLSRMLRGLRPIADDQLARIARALDVDLALLIAGTERAPRIDEAGPLRVRVQELEASLAERPTRADHERLRRHLRALEHTAQALAAERDELVAQRDDAQQLVMEHERARQSALAWGHEATRTANARIAALRAELVAAERRLASDALGALITDAEAETATDGLRVRCAG